MTALDWLADKGRLERDVPLGPLTTYKSGGPARYYAEIGERIDLDDLVGAGIPADVEILILGRGSNLLVSDTGFPGLVIRPGGEFSRFRITGTKVVAGAAVPLPRLARSSANAGLTGLEFFVGVPGSVGGAVRQNAGCFGTETTDRLHTATIVDLRTGEWRNPGPENLEFSYRHSNVSADELVVEAVFEAKPGDAEAAKAEIRRITRWRKENQPGGTFNAGSVFKNPPGTSAWELIEALGLKGLSIGDVAVSEKHANFFVAGPDAMSADIRRLVEEVKDQVLERTGTILEPEIQFVGFEE